MDAGSSSAAALRRFIAAALMVVAPLSANAAAPKAEPVTAASSAPAASVAPAAPDTHVADALLAQADAAYKRKDYAAAADAYDALIAGGARADGTYYDAACASALAGRLDAAFALLHRAIEAGFNSEWSLDNDGDLTALRSDPRWAGLRADFASAHPELALQHLMEDQQTPSVARYFAVRRAIAQGLVPPDPAHSDFLQFYANMAMFAGDYDTANARYGVKPAQVLDPVALGYDRAVPAIAEVVARARGRQAVFLNESHGIAATRASNFRLLAPLRKVGFNYLAMETMTTKARATPEGSCRQVDPDDPGLAKRGYPILGSPDHPSGYYFEEPVYGQLVREALRLGYKLVPYESVEFKTPSSREQDEADSLACLFKTDPRARLVVIAGFGHISERQAHSVPGGRMAWRFRQATGIDPFTVDTTQLLGLDGSRLRPATGKRAAPGEALVLRNVAAQDFGNDDYDLMLFVAADARREGAEPGWLTLGGARKAAFVPATRCAGRLPCLAEARVPGELPTAVPSDRCVIGDAAQAGCTLYLRPGRYVVGAQDEHQATIGQTELRVR